MIYTINYVSVTSESGKNSSESVEILSKDTGCTTSPDSDAFSVNTPSSIEGRRDFSDVKELHLSM